MTAEDLAERYARRAQTAVGRAEAGEAVVGIVGRDVPAVLVEAAGGVPFRLPAGDDDQGEAEDYLGRSIDGAALAVAAAILAGRYDALKGVLIAHDSEGSVRLFYALRELGRRGRIALPVQLVDQVHLDRDSTLRFNTTQLLRMLDTVSAWAGTNPDVDTLTAAWQRRYALLSELRRLRDRRAEADGPWGLTALHAYGVAAAADPEAVRAVGAALDAPSVSRDGVLPIHLTGSAPLGDALYRAVEAAGAVIVGEDHDWGDPLASDELPGEPPLGLSAAAEAAARARLAGAPASPSSSMAARAAATATAIRRSGARALLAVVREHDDAPLWDWRRQRDEAGVPSVLVRGADALDPEAIRAAVQGLAVSA